eukprot:2677241-Amphidinium_carterae.1
MLPGHTFLIRHVYLDAVGLQVVIVVASLLELNLTLQLGATGVHEQHHNSHNSQDSNAKQLAIITSTPANDFSFLSFSNSAWSFSRRSFTWHGNIGGVRNCRTPNHSLPASSGVDDHTITMFLQQAQDQSSSEQ